MANWDRQLLGKIARLYYEDGQTQAQIAERFGISRPIVSRKLAEAREAGIVKIFIDTGDDGMSDLERRLFSAFRLKGVRVASVPEEDEALGVQLTAQTGAQYLSEFLSPGDRIGVGWGWTLYELSTYLAPVNFQTGLVCQLAGSVDNAMTRGYANEIVGNLSRRLNAHEAYAFPCPVMVDNVIIADTLRHDLKVQSVLECGRSCNKLLVNIALPDKGSCLYQAGYLNDADLAHLEENHAVGSICCRFFDENGQTCDQRINERTMGISIEEIRKAECVMACITGRRKAKAVYCALRAGLIDVLVIDSVTAAEVVRLVEAQG